MAEATAPAGAPVETDAVALQAFIDKAVRKAAKKAAKASSDSALRAVKTSAANGPDTSKRPGGGGSNVNLGKPQHLSLSNVVRAIGAGAWGDYKLERDFGQSVQSILLNEDHEQGVAFAIPSSRSALYKVLAQTDFNFGQGKNSPAIRAWAARAADREAVMVAAAIRGDVSAMQAAYRDAGEGTTGAGGALVPPEFLQELYTLSIQTAVAFANAPGVTRIPVNSNLIYFPRETVMPASAVYAEAGVISETDPTFGQQAITIKKQAALNKFSNELLADSTPEYEAIIAKSLARSVGLRQDYEYLEGDGTGAHVLGLGSYSGLTTGYSVSTNGDAWGRAYNTTGPVEAGTTFPLKMLGAARAAGWEPNAWIMHPDVMSNGLAHATDANGRYLLESIGGVFGAPVPIPNIGALPTQITYVTPPWKAMLLGAPVFMTAQIPENEVQGGKSDCTHVYIGDFNFAHILERQAIELARADQIYFTTDQTAVRATARTAIVLLAPAAFMKQSGVRGATDQT